MAKNLIRKTLTGSGTFTAPAGVKSVKVFSKQMKKHIISNGHSFGFATDLSGQTWGWGLATSGQLGNNSTTSVSSPVSVIGNHRFVDISAGELHTLGRKLDGSTFAWGNGTGLGDNTIINKSSPVAIAGGHLFVEISAANDLSVGRKFDGSVYTWGNGANGGLGNNSTTSTSSPVAVVGGHVFTQISAHASTSANNVVALKSDGSAWTWGAGGVGNLGNNSTLDVSSPVAVVGGHIFTKVSMGLDFAVALKADGSAWAWGRNGQGQLGNNTTNNTSSPVAVVGGHSFIDISAGGWAANGGHTLALKKDGSIFAWGLNTNGQLGNNTASNTSSPIQVVGGSYYVEISAGAFSSFARRTDGSVWAWGAHDNGGLGNGQAGAGTDKSSPTQVIGQSFIPSSVDSNYNVIKKTTIAVTPGTSYNYSTGTISYFGNTQIDTNVDQLILEYYS